MSLAGIAIVCAVVFLLCWLVDTACKKLFPKQELEKGKDAVRPNRKNVIFGVVLTFASVAVTVFRLTAEPDVLLIVGCAVAFVLGVLLLVNFFSFSLFYDKEQFLLVRRSKKQLFTYDQIRGQRTLMTRGGYQTVLFVGDTQIELDSSMQNVNVFLGKAFYRWCEAKGVDPESVENNPRMMTWFPDPEL